VVNGLGCEAEPSTQTLCGVLPTSPVSAGRTIDICEELPCGNAAVFPGAASLVFNGPRQLFQRRVAPDGFSAKNKPGDRCGLFRRRSPIGIGRDFTGGVTPILLRTGRRGFPAQ